MTRAWPSVTVDEHEGEDDPEPGDNFVFDLGDSWRRLGLFCGGPPFLSFNVLASDFHDSPYSPNGHLKVAAEEP